MKKLLLGLGAATSVIAPIAAVVACGGETKKPGASENGTGTGSSATAAVQTVTNQGNVISGTVINGATLSGKVIVKATSDDDVTYTFKIIDGGTTKTVVVSETKSTTTPTMTIAGGSPVDATAVLAKLNLVTAIKDEADKQKAVFEEAAHPTTSAIAEAFLRLNPHLSEENKIKARAITNPTLLGELAMTLRATDNTIKIPGSDLKGVGSDPFIMLAETEQQRVNGLTLISVDKLVTGTTEIVFTGFTKVSGFTYTYAITTDSAATIAKGKTTGTVAITVTKDGAPATTTATVLTVTKA